MPRPRAQSLRAFLAGAAQKSASSRNNFVALTAQSFTVVFYDLMIFCCKTAQFGETRRKPDSLGLPMKNPLRNRMKNCAKNSLGNYEFPCSNR